MLSIPKYFINLKWLKEKELKVLVKDTLVFTQNADDAEIRPITFKTNDAVIVVSQMQKRENTIGLKRQLRDEELVSEK